MKKSKEMEEREKREESYKWEKQVKISSRADAEGRNYSESSYLERVLSRENELTIYFMGP